MAVKRKFKKPVQKHSAFSYRHGNSVLHRCPSWAKILFIPAVNILFLCLPPQFSLSLILIQTMTACALRFPVKEQIADLKPVIYYAFLLCVFQIFLTLFSKGNFVEDFAWKNQKETVFMLLRLFSMIQSASLLFKTSTSLELREGIGKIERRIRKILHLKERLTFTDTISMFLNFIPMVSKIWSESKRAWTARGGKSGVKMYIVLLPVLFSVGMKKAYNHSRALEIRRSV